MNANLKTKSNQTKSVYKYKTDTGSGGSLMPIRMFKVLFTKTITTNLNKYIDKKVIIGMYNNSCILQMGISRAQIINEGILMQHLCRSRK